MTMIHCCSILLSGASASGMMVHDLWREGLARYARLESGRPRTDLVISGLQCNKLFLVFRSVVRSLATPPE